MIHLQTRDDVTINTRNVLRDLAGAFASPGVAWEPQQQQQEKSSAATAAGICVQPKSGAIAESKGSFGIFADGDEEAAGLRAKPPSSSSSFAVFADDGEEEEEAARPGPGSKSSSSSFAVFSDDAACTAPRGRFGENAHGKHREAALQDENFGGSCDENDENGGGGGNENATPPRGLSSRNRPHRPLETEAVRNCVLQPLPLPEACPEAGSCSDDDDLGCSPRSCTSHAAVTAVDGAAAVFPDEGRRRRSSSKVAPASLLARRSRLGPG